MKYLSSKLKILFWAVALFIAAGLIALTLFYTYQENNSILSTRISSIEDQIAALGSAIDDSAAANQAMNEANRKQLQEIAKKSNGGTVVTPQENLVTSSVARTSPAVVSIIISKEMPTLEIDYLDPFGEDFSFENFDVKLPTFKQVGTERQEIAAGSGFIVDPDGYVLTNKHVVADQEADYTVMLSSGEKKSAKVVHRDSVKDIAILKIEGGKYTAAPLGDSSNLKLGQTVAAIGNALGQYNNSVSVGIISGLDRTIEAYDGTGQSEILSGTIQTDAAINRGSSGGPLLDLSGRVIGITVAMELGANNISFAIPINELKPVIERVIPK